IFKIIIIYKYYFWNTNCYNFVVIIIFMAIHVGEKVHYKLRALLFKAKQSLSEIKHKAEDTWERFEMNTERVLDSVSEEMDETWDTIEGTADKAWTRAKGGVGHTWEKIKDTSEDVWEGTKEGVEHSWDKV